MEDFVLFLFVGFLAQIVDGALGMAYGVISSTALLAFGITPAHASAAVHAAELATTAASGCSHLYHRNVDWQLFWRLAPFGMLGGACGAFLLTSFDGQIVKPFVTTYLALVGSWLLFRAFRKLPTTPVSASVVAPLGAVGGFLDAAGGGGWGPIVATGLLGAGAPPRYVLGTVTASEFLVALTVSASFLLALLTGHWSEASGPGTAAAVGGLIIGGLLAAPLAGWFVKTIPERLLLLAVGVLITMLAGWQTAQQLGFA